MLHEGHYLGYPVIGSTLNKAAQSAENSYQLLKEALTIQSA